MAKRTKEIQKNLLTSDWLVGVRLSKPENFSELSG